jgi:hypothetical protein
MIFFPKEYIWKLKAYQEIDNEIRNENESKNW